MRQAHQLSAYTGEPFEDYMGREEVEIGVGGGRDEFRQEGLINIMVIGSRKQF